MMRKFIAALCIFAAVPVLAQWKPTGATTGPIYYDSGNVGIGTATPTGLLTLRGSGAAVPLYLDNSNTAGYSVIRLNAGAAEASAGGAFAQLGSTTTASGAVSANSTALMGYEQGGLALAAVNSVDSNIRFYTGGWPAANERMRLTHAGKLGIGTSAPTARLHVFVNSGAEVDGIESNVQTTVSTNTTQTDNGLRAIALQNVQAGATNSGTVRGIRTQGFLSGAGTLSYAYGVIAEGGISGSATGTVTKAYGAVLSVFQGSGSVGTGYGLYVNDVQAANGYAIYAAGANDAVYVAGNVGIGTATPSYKLHVVGNAHVQGTLTGTDIEATYQDLAEWVPATSDLEPGTVVVLNPAASNEVTPSSNAYDTTVAGVVSMKPGISLGIRGEGKEQIATTGRVRVRVDATAGPIRVGDLLVTSGVSGTAMKSEPMDINGRKFHQPGTIIGKALEPLGGGRGEILVLLSMQ
jgi:hypothetical protein